MGTILLELGGGCLTHDSVYKMYENRDNSRRIELIHSPFSRYFSRYFPS